MARVVGSVLAFALLVAGQSCPPDIGTDPAEPPFGNPVPIVPGDIPSGCSDFEILAARGTSEIGKFGYRVGDPLIGNVTAVLPGARGYPVQYPASSEFDTGVAQGASDVAERVQSQAELCPDQLFALVGYSQGAMVMHSAVQLIPEALFDKISSIVLFGDPEIETAFPAVLEEKVLNNCASGDRVCDRSGTVCPYSHISYTYPEWMVPSTDFIVNSFEA